MMDGNDSPRAGKCPVVHGAITETGVQADVTLTAIRRVERAGARLHLALVENPVTYEQPPGSEGETEFHWIMRDFVTLPDCPLPVTPDAPVAMSGVLTLNSAWIQDHLSVIAFVQDSATREVLQAGFAPLGAPKPVPVKSTQTVPPLSMSP